MNAARRWLAAAPQPVFALFAGLMAFGTYFAMYAFRKPFAAAGFAGVAPVGVEYKVALVIAQVLGYALAKFIGVKVIAELPASRRIAGILTQIALAEAALVGFALIPPPWNIAALFLDGLALGMVWGMVFAFVEGRRSSEVIGAMLCASFIVSSGVVKAVGAALMLHWHVSEFAMPAVTGLVFLPLLLVCLAGLAVLPPPDAADIAQRVARVPMDSRARGQFLRRFGPGLAALIVVYVMLTVLRDFRDNFAAEIWAEQGLGGNADIFAWTELPVGAVVLLALAALTVVRGNASALAANFALVGLGLGLTGGATLAFGAHWIGPVAWMIALGGGLYLAYTPFNALLFDRLVAAGGEAGNAGFLIYVGDACGYTGSVALLIGTSFGGFHLAWRRVLIDAAGLTALLGCVLLALAALFFARRISAAPPIAP